MKFRVERDVLAEAVSWAARSLSPRPPVPVLSGLLLKAEHGTVSLSSFDYETSARLEIPAEIRDEGTILVSGRLLADICRSLPSAPVDIETDGSKVTLTCRRSSFHLATMPENEYPALPALPDSNGMVDGAAFSQAVSQVIIAASKDDTLPILTGVRLEFEDDLITFLATDRYRLAMKELPWAPTTPGQSMSALVKAKTLNEVAKTLGGSGELKLAITQDDSRLIAFESAGRATTSLLVDGDYPKIRSLFPETTAIHAVVNTSELVEAVRRVSLVAERNTPVRLAFTDGQVHLDAGTGEDAQASEELEARLEGEDITVAFNPGYLIEGLSVIETRFVRFSFTSAPKPAMLTAQAELEGEDSDDYRYLVMPVRLPN
ncbi:MULTISPECIES: DNA polymerase III subunit beta [Arthrobacter]|uniref:Beta sliding clamp n=1 Tax=Arthrobacter woluwensis TaxID=156980 RepID=A0A1H4K1A6_9MICC|nr:MULTISPECIES: DNA polymerase III subunit beta [Arthrobacter]MBO9704415.1 DNA polymerase III subunit beta [Arthrobacter sp.]PSS44143.1 DNA polymerase III subunit beta [Arthrobacter woluwensis]QTF72951.1 DNA polymerase III subunit beta [Arthrobacter woluwensis]WFR84070.1 DNA polymerase III subunit beta [Arthrobacter sp. Y-9]SEB52300.1 DNA polymerase III, beta subunit [Arthrobacter woluwensis]